MPFNAFHFPSKMADAGAVVNKFNSFSPPLLHTFIQLTVIHLCPIASNVLSTFR